MAFDTGTAPRAGLHVEERPPERGDGDLVVAMVHGSMDRCRSFLRVRARLADATVVLYDRRGYRRSRGAAPLARNVADHAADLVDVIAGRPAVVLGHSYGGDVALAAAERSRDVRAVVVYEPPLAWLPWWHAPGVPHELLPFAELDPGDAAESFVRRMIGDRHVERIGATARAELRADGPAFVAELTALRGGPPFDPANVEVPVIVARGSVSTSRQRQGADWLAAHLPHATLRVVAGAGHGAHLSHPDELAALVLEAAALAAAHRA